MTNIKTNNKISNSGNTVFLPVGMLVGLLIAGYIIKPMIMVRAHADSIPSAIFSGIVVGFIAFLALTAIRSLLKNSPQLANLLSGLLSAIIASVGFEVFATNQAMAQYLSTGLFFLGLTLMTFKKTS